MSDTDAERERRIRERAYFLWLEAGRPEGQSVEFWNRARMFEADPPPGGDLSSSAVADGAANNGRRTDQASHRASPSVPLSSMAPQARVAPRPLSFLLAVAALILGMAWVARRFGMQRAGRSDNRRASL